MTSCQECRICWMLTVINKQKQNKNITNASQSLLLIYRLTINYLIHQPHRWCNGERSRLKWVNRGFESGSNKSKTIKSVFVASLLSTQD